MAFLDSVVVMTTDALRNDLVRRPTEFGANSSDSRIEHAFPVLPGIVLGPQQVSHIGIEFRGTLGQPGKVWVF